MAGREKPPFSKNSDMFKPLIFPNHQRAFKIFNYLTAAALTYYGVFVFEWPEGKTHCFTWIREYKKKKMREIFYVDPSDPELQEHIREHSKSSTSNK